MQIADEMRPSPVVITILTALARIIPTWKLTPTPDVVDLAFRDPQVREEVFFILFFIWASCDGLFIVRQYLISAK